MLKLNTSTQLNCVLEHGLSWYANTAFGKFNQFNAIIREKVEVRAHEQTVMSLLGFNIKYLMIPGMLKTMYEKLTRNAIKYITFWLLSY